MHSSPSVGPRRLGPALLALLVGATVSWESLARRDDAPADGAPAPVNGAPPPAPADGTPEVWVTAFVDGELLPATHEQLGLPTVPGAAPTPLGRCPIWEARDGRCLDFVRFMPRSLILGSGEAPADQSAEITLAIRKGFSSLYLALWDGLVARWRRDGEPLGAELIALGLSALPDSNSLWGPSEPISQRVTALPDPSRWLLEDDWIAPDKGRPGPAPFRRVRYEPTMRAPQIVQSTAPPAPLAPPPELVLMRGRFAQRLVLKSLPFDTDLIRIGDEGAELFLRQIYPHAIGELGQSVETATGCLSATTPLACLRSPSFPPNGSPLLITADSAQGGDMRVLVERAAQVQFAAFTDLVGMRLLQYGRFEYDLSLARMLGALVAMTAAPGADSLQVQIGDKLNASLPGETDRAETGRRRSTARPANSATSIHYDAIPDGLVGQMNSALGLTGAERCLSGTHTVTRSTGGLASLEDTQPPTLIELTFERLGDLVKKDNALHYQAAADETNPLSLQQATAPFTGLTDTELVAALLRSDVLVRGAESAVMTQLERLKLENRLEGRCVLEGESGHSSAQPLEQLRGRALISHVRGALAAQLPALDDDPAAPAALEEHAMTAWNDVMTLHGSAPKLTERLGVDNVSPLAICTTKDRDEAQSEPVFKRVKVEVLFVAAEDTPPGQALWEDRAALPFLWIDDPKVNLPTVTQLVKLGDGLGVFKARWEVWAGWHLLWGAQEHPEGGSTALTGFASAICEDMVLAPPTLVPTLVRGGLLDAPLRGTHPVRRADVPEVPRAPNATSNDQKLAQASDAAQAGQSAVTSAELSVGQLSSNPEGALNVLNNKAAAGLDTLQSSGERPDLPGRDAPAAEYLRRLVQEPLSRRSQGKLTIMLVAEATLERTARGARQIVQSTPYLQRMKRLGDGLWLRLAAWALVLPPQVAAQQAPNVAVLPARLPNASVQATSVRPGWSRDPLTEMTLVVDVGVFGRQVDMVCDAAEFPPGYPPLAGCLTAPGGDEAGEGATPPLPFYDRVYSAGPSLTIGSYGTTWIGHEPRLALEYGAEAQLDIALTGDVSGIGRLPPIAARGGLLIGVRLARDPLWMTRFVRSRRLESGDPLPRLWGAEGDDGRSQLARTQLGMRAGVHLEPWTTIGGTPLVMSAEGWVGWARWRPRSSWATTSPYQPNALVGPYVRYQYAILPSWGAPEEGMNPILLDSRHQLTIGVRFQPRFDAARFEVPEVQ